jgi:hypothetical protein
VEIDHIEDLDKEQLAELSLNMFHQIMVHHTIYFMEVAHQFGMEKALEVMKNVWPTSYKIQMRRLSKTLGFEMENNIPKPLLDMPRDDLLTLIKGLGANWLAGDGIWFQSVEKELSMLDAQRCAGCAIMKYCTFEAWSIKQFLGLPELAGLEGLKKGLRFRLYHQINTQTIIDEKPDSLVFQMNDCIVQSTRRRKGLTDYPCKSTGIGEYRSFAESIDPRIVTECIGCPPDNHPEEWYCAWRFTIRKENE